MGWGLVSFTTVTDQVGSLTLKGFEKTIDTLKTKLVKELEEVKVIRGIDIEAVR